MSNYFAFEIFSYASWQIARMSLITMRAKRAENVEHLCSVRFILR